MLCLCDNNSGLSYGFSCGDFECKDGGDLVIYPDAEDKDYLGDPQYIDYEMTPTKFDANNVFHTTNPTITGEQYSILSHLGLGGCLQRNISSLYVTEARGSLWDVFRGFEAIYKKSLIKIKKNNSTHLNNVC
jgi:hypothetical protein